MSEDAKKKILIILSFLFENDEENVTASRIQPPIGFSFSLL